MVLKIQVDDIDDGIGEPDVEVIGLDDVDHSHIGSRPGRQRELREQLEYDDNGSVTLLVDMLRSSIEMAKENALATLLELVLHDKCADLVMRAGGIQPLVDLKRNSRNEVEEELAAQVLDTVSKLRYDWHNTVVDAELTEKERARMKERLDPYYLPAEVSRSQHHSLVGRRCLHTFVGITLS